MGFSRPGEEETEEEDTAQELPPEFHALMDRMDEQENRYERMLYYYTLHSGVTPPFSFYRPCAELVNESVIVVFSTCCRYARSVFAVALGQYSSLRPSSSVNANTLYSNVSFPCRIKAMHKLLEELFKSINQQKQAEDEPRQKMSKRLTPFKF